MPELPEIVLRAREFDRELAGRSVASVNVQQPKCLNVPPEEFQGRLTGRRFGGSHHRGKWIVSRVGEERLLTNLGMGGEVLLHAPGEPLPEKTQAVIALDDGHRLSVHFWWFGYLHLAPGGRLGEHAMTASLGPDALSEDLTLERFTELLAGRRTRIKNLLLDQNRIAGIGNMYSHDILFEARVHPMRPANSLGPDEGAALWEAMRAVLQRAIDLGGARWELDLHGRPGGFDTEHLAVGYREGEPCPSCGTAVIKLKTGSTSSFICPACQPEAPPHDGEPAA